MDAEQPFAISCYYNGPEELKLIQETLEAVNSSVTKIYQGVVDGWITNSKLAILDKELIRYEIPGKRAPMPVVATSTDPENLKTEPVRRSKHVDPELERTLETFQQLATKVVIDTTQGIRIQPSALVGWMLKIGSNLLRRSVAGRETARDEDGY